MIIMRTKGNEAWHIVITESWKEEGEGGGKEGERRKGGGRKEIYFFFFPALALSVI